MASLGELSLTLTAATGAFDSALTKSTAIAAGLATAIAGVAVKASADFEQAIVNAGAKASATAAQLDKLNAAATKAGLESAFSAKQAADALGLLAQAGLSVDEQTAALPGVLNLASAGMLDLSMATDIAIGAVKGFGLSVDELGRVNDVLVKASNAANTSVEDLGMALSYAAPTAAGLGVSIEEVSAAVGILGNAGIKATRAGTSLNNIVASLGTASKKLGAGFTNADVATLGLAGALEKLQESGLSSANAVDVFGKNAGPAVAAMLNQGIDSIRELDKALQNAGGTAAEIAAKQLDTFSGQVTLLQGSVETLAAKLGSALTPVLRSIATDLIDQTNALLQNEDAMKAFGKSVQSAVLEASTALDALAPVLTVVTTAFGALVDGVRVLNVAASTLAIGIGGMVEGYLQMQVAMNHSSENVQALAEHQARLNGLVQDTRQTIDNFGSSTMAGVSAGDKLTEATQRLAAKMKEGAANIDLTTKAVDDLAEKATKTVGPMDELELVLNGFPAPDKPNDYANALDKVKTKAQSALEVVRELFDLMKQRQDFANVAAGYGESYLAEQTQVYTPVDDNPMWEEKAVGAAPMPGAVEQKTNALGSDPTVAALAALTGGTSALTAKFSEMWQATAGFQQIMESVNGLLDKVFRPVMEGIMGSLSEILKPVIDLFGALAPLLNIVLEVMNPFAIGLKIVAAAIKPFADVIGKIVKAIKVAVNSIRVFVANIGRKKDNKAKLDENGNIIDPKGKIGPTEAVNTITDEVAESSESMASGFDTATKKVTEFSKSVTLATESLTNVPQLFRTQLRRAQASQSGFNASANLGSIAGGVTGLSNAAPGQAGTVIVEGNVVVVTNDPDEFTRNMQRRNFVSTGAPIVNTSGTMVFAEV